MTAEAEAGAEASTILPEHKAHSAEAEAEAGASTILPEHFLLVRIHKEPRHEEESNP